MMLLSPLNRDDGGGFLTEERVRSVFALATAATRKLITIYYVMLGLPPILLIQHVQRFSVKHQICIVDGVWLFPEFLGLEVCGFV